MKLNKEIKKLNEKHPHLILLLRKLRNLIMLSKVYISRSTGYISITNSGMILFLFLSRLQEYGLNINLQKYGIIIFIFTMAALIIFGFLEDKLGFYTAEKKFGSSRDPYISSLKQIQKDIKEIKKELKNENKR